MDNSSTQQSLDFTALVQNNPTIISLNFQSELANKLKESFTEEQEKWYVANLYAYLKFHPTNDYVIDLENVFQMIGFANKGSAKRTLGKHFNQDEDYKVALNQLVKRKNEGGTNKEKIMLNINTFKELCLLAKTVKGKEIRKYYVKLETILNEIAISQFKESQLELVKKDLLLQTKETINQKLQEENRWKKHKMLLQEYGFFGSLIYIIKVKTLDDRSYIVKLGRSDSGIKGRYSKHKAKYEECLILDCFGVKNSLDFETFLKQHLRLHRVDNLKNHEKETELFLIGKNYSYKQLIDTIQEHIKYHNDDYTEIEKLRLQNDNLKMTMNENKDYGLNNVMEMLTIMNNKIDKLEAKINENKEIMISRTAKMTTNFAEPRPTIGPRLQQINPESLHLVKVFDSVTECLVAHKHMKRPSITKAVNENTIYNGFRWNLVDRDLDANIVQNLAATKATRLQKLGYIAKMDRTKTNILNIYLDRKTAATMNNYPSHASLDNTVKDCKPSNGNYYILYDNLSNDIKEKYITPILYKDGVGKFDLQGNLVQEFTCKYECIRNKVLSEKSLSKALRTGMAYDGYFYKLIGEKLMC